MEVYQGFWLYYFVAGVGFDLRPLGYDRFHTKILSILLPVTILSDLIDQRDKIFLGGNYGNC